MADVTTGIVVWYKFEDTTTTDSSGNGYTGTLAGTPTLTLGPGRIGQGLVFSGTNTSTSQVQVPPAAVGLASGTSSFSTMGWVSTATDSPIVLFRNSGNGNPILNLMIGYNGIDNGGTRFASCVLRANDGSGLAHINGTTALSDGNFHHLAMVYDGSVQTLTLYVDGASVGSASAPLATGITFDATGCTLGYGSYGNIGTTIGTIDDFRFYNVALTAQNISDIYNAAPPPPVPKTFWVLNTAAPSPNYFGQLQDGGTTPTAVLSSYGWTVAKSATAYWRARLGASATATTTAATSYIDSATGPTKGTGATNTTAGDAFISPTAYSGIFSSGNWTLSFGMRTAAATCTGRIRCRVWASANADGSNARALTSGTLIGSTVTMSATATTYTSSVTWAAPQITLSNEYLFFQVEWNVTSAGSNNSCTAQFYVSTASIATTGFTPTTTATLAVTETPDTISAAGNVPVVITGTLAITETLDTISAAGSVTVRGTLGITQANQTVSATGAPAAVGNLTITQAAQTISATGNIPTTVTGTLAITQAAQTLSATGGVLINGALTATQANNTLSAAGGPRVGGTLTQTQANNTLVAAGGVQIGGTLNVTQAAQTLSAVGRVAVGGTLTVIQAAQTLSAVGRVTVGGTLSVTQAAQTLSGAGSVLSGIVGALGLTQAAQTLSAAGTVPNVIGGTLTVTQAAQTLSATGTVFTGITGTLVRTQADNVLTATGTVRIGATLVLTQANNTLIAAGNVPLGAVTGTLTITQANQTLSATGLVPITQIEAMHTLSGGSLYVAGSVKTAAGPVSSLPYPGRPGTRNFVTDATVPLASGVGNIVTGGGSNKVPVYDDGANWRIG